jgi:hypothetical protein
VGGKQTQSHAATYVSLPQVPQAAANNNSRQSNNILSSRSK